MDDWYDDSYDDYNNEPEWEWGNGGNFRNDRYSNAYGDYNGGYGRSGTLGPSNRSGPMRPLRPFGPPPGSMDPFMWSTGYDRPRPATRRTFGQERNLRHLRCCGVSNEALKNIPFQLLKLYERDKCGLCGLTFESFASSRLHYVSKNHSKNQKKWIMKQTENGQCAKDAPLKSRDLYCELCDVEITSKSHAESHYAGKPHRSIVEGRKVPKNLLLLQKRMNKRVEQLIRREKKFLNAEEPQEKKLKEEPKAPTQPELHCDICKTSVTCSEQMTHHLNGKRHLSKEKSHILRMMKGEDPNAPKDTEQTPEVEDEDQDDGEEAEDDEAEAEKDNYDWGNGSGDWE